MKDLRLDCEHQSSPVNTVWFQESVKGLTLVECFLKREFVPAKECNPDCKDYIKGRVLVSVHKPKFPRFKAFLERLAQRIP